MSGHGQRNTDLQIGRQLRRRRRLMGLTQAELAHQIGVAPQQIQKYECGGARMSASRLFDIAGALQSPIEYFFAALGKTDLSNGGEQAVDVLSNPETAELVAAYYGVPARSRRHLLDLAKALNDDSAGGRTSPPSPLHRPRTPR